MRRFRKAVQGLRKLLPDSALVLTSPFVRARETAQILVEVAGLKKPKECEELAAGSPVARVFELMRAHKGRALVLVGHEPDLGSLLAAAVAGPHAHVRIEFKKGGAACIAFANRIEAGRATLEWLLPPRVLRALR